MIGKLTGRVGEYGEEHVEVACGAVSFDILLPVFVHRRMMQEYSPGTPVTLFLYAYLEGAIGGGTVLPRAVGFLSPEEKNFFLRFITVPGIGIRKAVKALAAPPQQIAAAIENGDVRFLSTLPEIGKRTAEKVIAELKGRVDAWLAGGPFPASVAPQRPLGAAAEMEDEVLAVLLQLGHRRGEAEALLASVRANHPEMTTTGQVIQEIYRMQTARNP